MKKEIYGEKNKLYNYKTHTKNVLIETYHSQNKH